MKKYTDGEILADALRGALMEKRQRELAQAARTRRPAGHGLAKRGPSPSAVAVTAAPRPVIYNLQPDVQAAVEAMKAVRRQNTLPQRGS